MSDRKQWRWEVPTQWDRHSALLGFTGRNDGHSEGVSEEVIFQPRVRGLDLALKAVRLTAGFWVEECHYNKAGAGGECPGPRDRMPWSRWEARLGDQLANPGSGTDTRQLTPELRAGVVRRGRDRWHRCCEGPAELWVLLTMRNRGQSPDHWPAPGGRRLPRGKV